MSAPHSKYREALEQLLSRHNRASYREDNGGEVTLLDLGETDVSEAELQLVSCVNTLEVLWLDHCPCITDASLAALRPLKRLQILSLRGTNTSDAGVDNLLDLQVLRLLDVRSTGITVNGLKRLSALANLNELRCDHDEVVSLILRRAAKTRKKRGRQTGALTEHEKKRAATILFENLGGVSYDVSGFADGIGLYQAGVTEEHLRHLRALPDCVSLNVGENDIGDSATEFIAPLRKLTFLDISRTNITRFEFLQNLRALEDLELHALHTFTDAEAVHLHDLSALKRLNLSCTSITPTGLTHIASLPKLADLDLAGTAMTDAAIATLAKMTSLARLSLGSTHCTSEAIGELRHALPNCTILWNRDDYDATRSPR